MLSAKEIRNIRFGTSTIGGYKKEEVDVLLDKIESDYEQFERTLREMTGRINDLKAELEDYQNSHGNIQNVLISAQKFADQLVEDAKSKSDEIIASAHANIEKITAQEKELTTAFDKKAGERKMALQNDIEKIVASAQEKQAAVETATQDCIDRQQLLFNKMKVEIAAFKAEITNKYKEHLELLASLPDAVPNDPSEIAAAVAFKYDHIPSVEQYVENPQDFDLSEPVEESNEFEAEVEAEEPAEKFLETIVGKGFVINADEFEIDSEETEEEQEN